MFGINTPESRTRDLEEKARGLESKKRLTELLYKDDMENLVLQTKEKGKYGRYLGIVLNVGNPDSHMNINQTLISEGYAVAYFGGKR